MNRLEPAPPKTLTSKQTQPSESATMLVVTELFLLGYTLLIGLATVDLGFEFLDAVKAKLGS